MTHITLTGVLLDPNGEFAAGDRVRFTHRTTTGKTIKTAQSTLTIPHDGSYSIDLKYGEVMIEYRVYKKPGFKNVGVVIVNQDSTASTIPELLNAVVPPTDEQLLEFQAILADCVAARDEAEEAADSIGSQLLGEAPNDGKQYARQGETWEEVDMSTVEVDVEEAPDDGKQYVRQGETWVEVSIPESGVEEAPTDSKLYGRKDETWEEVNLSTSKIENNGKSAEIDNSGNILIDTENLSVSLEENEYGYNNTIVESPNELKIKSTNYLRLGSDAPVEINTGSQVSIDTSYFTIDVPTQRNNFEELYELTSPTSSFQMTDTIVKTEFNSSYVVKTLDDNEDSKLQLYARGSAFLNASKGIQGSDNSDGGYMFVRAGGADGGEAGSLFLEAGDTYGDGTAGSVFINAGSVEYGEDGDYPGDIHIQAGEAGIGDADSGDRGMVRILAGQVVMKATDLVAIENIYADAKIQAPLIETATYALPVDAGVEGQSMVVQGDGSVSWQEVSSDEIPDFKMEDASDAERDIVEGSRSWQYGGQPFGNNSQGDVIDAGGGKIIVSPVDLDGLPINFDTLDGETVNIYYDDVLEFPNTEIYYDGTASSSGFYQLWWDGIDTSRVGYKLTIVSSIFENTLVPLQDGDAWVYDGDKFKPSKVVTSDTAMSMVTVAEFPESPEANTLYIKVV